MFSLGLCIPMAMGQTVTGSITGEVSDPSGAVILGAQVMSHNLDTGVDSSAATNAVGLYRIDFLPTKIGHRAALPPLRNGLGVDPMTTRRCSQALLTMLYRSTDRLGRGGASV